MSLRVTDCVYKNTNLMQVDNQFVIAGRLGSFVGGKAETFENGAQLLETAVARGADAAFGYTQFFANLIIRWFTLV